MKKLDAEGIAWVGVFDGESKWSLVPFTLKSDDLTFYMNRARHNVHIAEVALLALLDNLDMFNCREKLIDAIVTYGTARADQATHDEWLNTVD